MFYCFSNLYMLCILNISNLVVQMSHDGHGAVLNLGQYGSKKKCFNITCIRIDHIFKCYFVLYK